MTIISQDKTLVIHGDIADLYIDEQSTIRADMRGDPDDAYVLGTYSTRSQAQDVLLRLAKRIDADDAMTPYQMPPDRLPSPEHAEWVGQLARRFEETREEAKP